MTGYLTCFRILIPAALFYVALTGPARADLIITGGTATVAPGGTGTVEFMLSATPGTSYELGSFNLEVQISVASGTSFLQFATSQLDPYANSEYVFFGHSFGEDNGIPFWGNPFDSSRPSGTHNDTITGGDAYATPDGFTQIDSSSHFLLARVQFQADPHASAGDSFRIAVVSDPNQTFFLAPDPDVFAFTTTDASVTVRTSENPLPEPTSLALAGVGSLTCLLYSRRSRRKASGP